MSLTPGKENSTVSPEILLTKSIQLYQGISDKYTSLPKLLQTQAPGDVEKTMGEINSLFKDAKIVDDMIGAVLSSQTPISSSLSEQIEQREQLIKRLLESNKSMSGKAENVKSYVRNELSHVSTSRHAMRGYTQPTSQNRKIINSSY